MTSGQWSRILIKPFWRLVFAIQPPRFAENQSFSMPPRKTGTFCSDSPSRHKSVASPAKAATIPRRYGFFQLQERRVVLRGRARGEDCARGGDTGFRVFEG